MKNPVKHLSEELGFCESNIHYVIRNKAKFYHPIEKPKDDGSIRIVYRVRNPMKELHLKIKERYFKIDYPHYLHGGISNRSIITNADVHRQAKSLIVMDIQKCFPSIKREHIRCLFKKWNYTDNLADVLSNILTFNDELPQGACCSSLIANLVLFNERELVNDFKQNNYQYSRYIDDIAVSSKRELSENEVQEIKQKIFDMVEKNKFSINCKKTKVHHASAPDTEDKKFMIVTGIKVDGKNLCASPYFSDSVLKEIITICPDYHENEKSIQGRIAHIKSIDSKKGQEFEKLFQNKKDD